MDNAVITSTAAECLMESGAWDLIVDAIVPRLGEIDSDGINALLPEVIGSVAFYVGRCPEFTQNAPGLVDWVNIAETMIECARLGIGEDYRCAS